VLIILAWKNVWRNRRRSLIMLSAIAVGLWGGLVAVGIFTGMYDTMISAAIDRNLTHLQLHAPGFREERRIDQTLPAPDALVNALRSLPHVAAVSARTLIDGMASSPASNRGVTVVGIEPASERAATALARRLTEGTFFNGTDRAPVVIGRTLAEKLGLRLRSKMVLAFQRPDGVLVSGAFRVAGIFDTESSAFDGFTVLVRRADLTTIVGAALTHEIAVRLDRSDSLAAFSRTLAASFPGVRVDTWRELAPELNLAESSDVTMGIFLGIILLGLVFGITNTMLMSVLDRVREFGVLMAVGMKRRRIFAMIVFETLLLSVLGAMAGTLFGALTVSWLGRTGINLGWFSSGLSLWGISSMLYPIVHPVIYPSLGAMVVAASMAAALYPAVKAVRLNPVAAIAA
jgi:ABC-type lipoprotein release transport system permease subunit